MREFSVTDIEGDILRVVGNKVAIYISVNEFVDAVNASDASSGRVVELSPEAAIRLAENLLRRVRKAKP
jgi:hypothetical protein